MNKYSQIRNLQELDAERQLLRKEVGKRERIVLRDLNGIHESWMSWTNSLFRIKNLLNVFLPKLEFATVLFPVLRRLFGRKKK